ncbi:SNase-domain-containing protein [Parathielavia hyrcaniae]|uniref:Probable endonuclease LCL3 n=1 Tax=Parathielavia hyrcaniae TaxID=113614 RepID=A0AAN6Q9A4_9PEZI|nr:SNase-domain-containing protein [Parathielavia hyrcaniae]
MCFHRRLVFSCSHHAWLGVTQPCSVEKAFDRGEADTGCGARWSHGFDTVRVQQQCAGCVQARAGAEYRFGVVREQLRVIREHLELIKGVTVGEQGEDGKGEGEAEKEKKDGEREEGESSTMKLEETRVDSKHRPLTLPRVLTTQLPKDVDGYENPGTMDYTSRGAREAVGVRKSAGAASRTGDFPLGWSPQVGSRTIMRWSLFSASSPSGRDDEAHPKPRPGIARLQMPANDRPKASPPSATQTPNQDSGFDSITSGIRDHLAVPHNWIAPAAAAALTLGLYTFYQSYLRRIPAPSHIRPSFFRRRSLFGTVTSVGDGDGFHMFHTPGGRLAGWGWLRRVPKDKKELKGRTISIRIAGVDAPEGAHFGRPAQPFAAEALAFLESYVLRRRVRVSIYRRDQYERVVATAYVRRPPFFFPRRDVGLELLRRGLAVAYEGKTGAEFGGAGMEAQYRAAEEVARRKGRGLWGVKGGKGESPMEYKRRIKMLEEKAGGKV